jgi:hypothetical protein
MAMLTDIFADRCRCLVLIDRLSVSYCLSGGRRPVASNDPWSFASVAIEIGSQSSNATTKGTDEVGTKDPSRGAWCRKKRQPATTGKALPA